MEKTKDYNPFLFPSTVPNYSSSLSSSASLSPSPPQSNPNSPLIQYPLALSPSNSSVLPSSAASAAALGPCAVCRILGRQCTDRCFSSSYFPRNESEIITIVDRVFGGGATNIIKFMQEQNNIVNELNQGKELAVQLTCHLNSPEPPETHQFLVTVGKIISSYDKLLSLLNWSPSVTESKLAHSPLESTNSYANNSSRIDAPCQDLEDQLLENIPKKRKMQPLWTAQVKVPDDGYSWEKYGQKHIFGAQFPRIYYRCIHRQSQGCLATKQIQKSDEDPTVLEVTYKGEHSCVRVPPLGIASASQINGNSESEQNEDDSLLEQNERTRRQSHKDDLTSQDLETAKIISPSFSFPELNIAKEQEQTGISSGR